MTSHLSGAAEDTVKHKEHGMVEGALDLSLGTEKEGRATAKRRAKKRPFIEHLYVPGNVSKMFI